MSEWWWRTHSTDVAAMREEIARYSSMPSEAFTALEDFMTEPKEQPADDAPDDEQPEPDNAPVEELPPPEDDASTSPVTEGEGL